jgi:SulP family sulfate permease
MILALFIFMKRMSEYSKTTQLTRLFQERGSDFPERSDPESISRKKVPSGVEVFEIDGPFFFGAADMLQDVLGNWQTPPKVFILRMRHVPFIDASGMHALREFYYRCQKSHTHLLLAGVPGHSEQDLIKFGLNKLIGNENIFYHIDQALSQAERLVHPAAALTSGERSGKIAGETERTAC